MTSYAPTSHTTKGWQPLANVAVYLAAHQEGRAARRDAPSGPPAPAPLAQGAADAGGVLTITVIANTPLLAYGPRADPSASPWVATMAHPPEQVKPMYTVAGRFSGEESPINPPS